MSAEKRLEREARSRSSGTGVQAIKHFSLKMVRVKLLRAAEMITHSFIHCL